MSELEIIEVPDIISEIISDMKSSGTISSIADNGDGTWKITTTNTNNLEDNFKVEIDSNLYRVDNVTTKTFDITGSSLSGLASETWEMYFKEEIGHRIEVAGKLSRIVKDKRGQERWDLIWLLTDNEEITPLEDNNNYAEVRIFIIIATGSTKDLSTQERLDQKFTPILSPIYRLMVRKLNDSKKLARNPGERINPTKFNRYYYGVETEQGNEELILNTEADAIEFTTTIKIKKQFINQC